MSHGPLGVWVTGARTHNRLWLSQLQNHNRLYAGRPVTHTPSGSLGMDDAIDRRWQVDDGSDGEHRRQACREHSGAAGGSAVGPWHAVYRKLTIVASTRQVI